MPPLLPEIERRAKAAGVSSDTKYAMTPIRASPITGLERAPRGPRCRLCNRCATAGPRQPRLRASRRRSVLSPRRRRTRAVGLARLRLVLVDVRHEVSPRTPRTRGPSRCAPQRCSVSIAGHCGRSRSAPICRRCVSQRRRLPAVRFLEPDLDVIGVGRACGRRQANRLPLPVSALEVAVDSRDRQVVPAPRSGGVVASPSKIPSASTWSWPVRPATVALSRSYACLDGPWTGLAHASLRACERETCRRQRHS